MDDKIKPAKMLAMIIEFYKSATLEVFVKYFFDVPFEDIDDYHKGKFHKFQRNMGKFLCYLDYESRRRFCNGVIQWAKEYEESHDFKITY